MESMCTEERQYHTLESPPHVVCIYEVDSCILALPDHKRSLACSSPGDCSHTISGRLLGEPDSQFIRREVPTRVPSDLSSSWVEERISHVRTLSNLREKRSFRR